MYARELARAAVVDHRACQCIEELSALLGILPTPLKNTLEIGVGDDNGTLWLWKQISESVLGVDIMPACKERDPENVIVGDSRDPETLQRVRGWFRDEPLDFLFIDGAHAYDDVMSDYDMYGPLVREGGVIAFHDINEDGPDPGVKKFWRDLQEQTGTITLSLVVARPGIRNPLGIGVLTGNEVWGWNEREGWPFGASA